MSTLTPPLHWFRQTLPAAIDTMEGWCAPAKALRLFDLVVAEKPLVSVELGVFGGRSLFALACGHWAVNHGRVTGYDPYTVPATQEGTNAPENDQWWQTVELMRISHLAFAALCAIPHPYWHLYAFHSVEAAGNHPNQGVHLLHQDSNHSEEVSCAELLVWAPKMAPNALWILDDAKWDTLKEVQRRMVEVLGWTLEEDHGDWRVYRVKA